MEIMKNEKLNKALIFSLFLFIYYECNSQVKNKYEIGKVVEFQSNDVVFDYRYDLLGNRTFYKITKVSPGIIDLEISNQNQKVVLVKDIENEILINISNSGTANAGSFFVDVYFSNDEQLQPEDSLLQKKFVAGVDAGNSISEIFLLQIPSHFIENSAYLIFQLDSENIIKETNEQNNQLIIPVSIITQTQANSEVQFSSDAQFGCSGTEVQFTDQSENNPFEWYWVFPGGSPSSSQEQNPLVTYYTEGTFPATLTITNENGVFTRQIQNQVEISNNPLLTIAGIPEVLSPEGGEFTITINNECGTTLDWYAQLLELDSDWITITSDMSGTKPGTLTIQYQPSGGVPRSSQLLVNARNVKNGEQLITISQGIHLSNTQTVRLDKGWNLVSLYVNPGQKNTAQLFQPILNEIEEIRNFAGDVYTSDLNETSFDVHIKEAFWIKVKTDVEIPISGELINPAQTPISLKEGENWVSFFGQPQRVESALSSIFNSVVLVKTELNNHSQGYKILNSMDVMLPGQGYIIEVDKDVVLNYSQN